MPRDIRRVVRRTPEPDPVFNFGNKTALDLFEMTWDEFTQLPSRMSAEPMHRAEREALLREVHEQGYSTGYQGIRISKSGKRFRIEDTTVWNMYDEQGQHCGQAATYARWTYLNT